jgi:hypothetical protein
MKSGNLNFLEPSGALRPVTGLLYLFTTCFGLSVGSLSGRNTESKIMLWKRTLLRNYRDIIYRLAIIPNKEVINT